MTRETLPHASLGIPYQGYLDNARDHNFLTEPDQGINVPKMTADKSHVSITLWSWLFPLTFLIHVAEELYGGEGYPAYVKRLRGVNLTETKFLVGQAIGLALIVFGIFIARRFDFPRQLIVILGTVVAVNGISHLGTSLYYRGYGPGLISGVLIWIPLGVAALIRFRSNMQPHRYWLYVLLGIGINLAIALLALNGGKA